MKFLLFVLTIILFASCFNRGTKNTQSDIAGIRKQDSIPTLDTTIILSNITTSKYNGINLTENLAKKILFKHFKNKGDVLPNMKFIPDSMQKCIQYDTIYFTDFNHNKYSDAIIEYTELLCGSSSHCWQQSKAIIIDSDDGYKIINEEFIPTNFCIDSVVTKNRNVIVFGYDYDCGDNKILRHYKLTLK